MHLPTPKSLAFPLLVTALASGGGTMANLKGKEVTCIGPSNVKPPEILGGVCLDAKWIGRCVEDAQENPLLPILKIPVYAFFMADMPFSFVGDLLTIPGVKR